MGERKISNKGGGTGDNEHRAVPQKWTRGTRIKTSEGKKSVLNGAKKGGTGLGLEGQFSGHMVAWLVVNMKKGGINDDWRKVDIHQKRRRGEKRGPKGGDKIKEKSIVTTQRRGKSKVLLRNLITEGKASGKATGRDPWLTDEHSETSRGGPTLKTPVGAEARKRRREQRTQTRRNELGSQKGIPSTETSRGAGGTPKFLTGGNSCREEAIQGIVH